MVVDVYADLLFLINAGMDGLCFCLTARLLHRRLTPWRVILGSVLGGVYAVVSLFLSTGQVTALLADLLACLLMCLLVFGGRGSGGGRRVLLSAGGYLFLSTVMGGIMTALYRLLNRAGIPDLLPEGSDGIGAWLFLFLTVAGGLISLRGGRFLRREATRIPCTVTVTLAGRTATLTGMVDTGNLLRDPIGGRAVICADRDCLRKILSPTLWEALGGDPHSLNALSPSEGRRIRIIPTGTATGSGILYGILPDTITIAKNDDAPREVDAVVAVTVLEEVQALVPNELI